MDKSLIILALETLKDKIEIVNKFILPEIYKNIGIENIIDIDNKVIEFIIENYTREAGVRKLKEIMFEIHNSATATDGLSDVIITSNVLSR